MKDTMTTKSQREPVVDPDGVPADNRTSADARGDTHAKQSGSARMPHERDESADNQQLQEASNKKMGDQAYADATGPQEDTDKGPMMGKVYREGVKPGADDPDHRDSK
ncbi:hypothetical protein [Xylophilus ampelinus]|uniref:Uncharacterized protein n=1 Tax=Xylophilus ampelinus TaxID=54067 RepID=A0A318SEC9_9BURK|nr:hypothetical protein [Xylophilus ampelinus]MCS4511690.1 hypothetical protein [Xylophilus ampelinus]PYE74206.1 hypothetical protein DFQ15_12932 [Xylophilus ampelinus]